MNLGFGRGLVPYVWLRGLAVVATVIRHLVGRLDWWIGWEDWVQKASPARSRVFWTVHQALSLTNNKRV